MRPAALPAYTGFAGRKPAGEGLVGFMVCLCVWEAQAGLLHLQAIAEGRPIRSRLHPQPQTPSDFEP